MAAGAGGSSEQQQHLWEALLYDDAPALAEALAAQQRQGAPLPTGPGGLMLLHGSALFNSPQCVAALAAAGAPLDAGLMHSYSEVADCFAAWQLVIEGRLQLGRRLQCVLEAGRQPLAWQWSWSAQRWWGHCWTPQRPTVITLP